MIAPTTSTLKSEEAVPVLTARDVIRWHQAVNGSPHADFWSNPEGEELRIGRM
jgi:hypothetical protein